MTIGTVGNSRSPFPWMNRNKLECYWKDNPRNSLPYQSNCCEIDPFWGRTSSFKPLEHNRKYFDYLRAFGAPEVYYPGAYAFSLPLSTWFPHAICSSSTASEEYCFRMLPVTLLLPVIGALPDHADTVWATITPSYQWRISQPLGCKVWEDTHVTSDNDFVVMSSTTPILYLIGISTKCLIILRYFV